MKSKMEEYRRRDNGDLKAELEEKVRECFDMRFQQASEKATHPGLRRALLKDVARIKTLLRERELGREA